MDAPNEGGNPMQNGQPKYDESFKKSVVSLYQNGKSQTQISKEYGISSSAINRWVKQYSEIKLDDEEGTIMTAKQIKELQRRNAALEEENLILKKAIAIFTPHASRD
jgi:transposase